MWVQKVSLDFHFIAEQQSRSFSGAFFNFNGTAGVWRISCIEDAGGWEAGKNRKNVDFLSRI
jgi:beta-mannan synthase